MTCVNVADFAQLCPKPPNKFQPQAPRAAWSQTTGHPENPPGDPVSGLGPPSASDESAPVYYTDLALIRWKLGIKAAPELAEKAARGHNDPARGASQTRAPGRQRL